MTLLQHHILALWLTALTTFGLGLLVFLAEPRRRLNQIFGLYSLAISWWALNEAFVVNAADQATATLFVYLEWLGIVFIAPTGMHTVFLLTEDRTRGGRIWLIAGYLLSVIFLILHLLFTAVVRLPKPVGYTHFFSQLTPIAKLHFQGTQINQLRLSAFFTEQFLNGLQSNGRLRVGRKTALDENDFRHV